MADTPVIPIEFKFDDADFKKLASQMEKLYKDAEKFAKAIKGKDGSGGTAAANRGLKTSVASMEKLRAKMEAYTKESKRAGNTIHGMQSKMKALKIQSQLATDPVKARKYANEMKNIQKQLVKAKNTTAGWGKAMGSFQFKFNALGNIASNVASTISRKIGQALKDAVKTMIDFEKSFAAVLTLLNKTGKDRFKEVLKQNSVDIMKEYGLTVEDTNKAMFDAISAGVKIIDVYKVLDSAARLAVGGVTDLNSATKGIASVMNAFSLEMDEAGDVASAFFQAQKFGITYIDEMVASMGRANTIASLSGASYRDMLAAFTAITKSGLNTEESITGLRNVFKELVASSGEAANELNRLGIATGANAVKERGFIGVLDDLNEAYLKNNEVIPKVFGNIRGLTGIMGIVGKRYSTFKFILEQVNDTMASNEALTAAVGEQMNTTAKKLDVLKSTWDAFVISITDSQSEQGSVIKTLIDGLTKLLEVLTPDYYEEYTEAMANARIEVEAFGVVAKEVADKRRKLIDDDELAEKAYTRKLILEYKLRINGAKDAVSESERIYIESQKRLAQARLEKEDPTLRTDISAAKKVQNVIDAAAATDLYKVNMLKLKAVYELLLAELAKITKAEEDLTKSELELSGAARKNAIKRVNVERDINIALLKLRDNEAMQKLMIAEQSYLKEIELLELSEAKTEEIERQKYLAKLKYIRITDDIKKKYAEIDIKIDSDAVLAKINVTKAGFDKEIALLKENHDKKKRLIAATEETPETKKKLNATEDLKYQEKLTKITLKYEKKRITIQKEISLATLNLKKDSYNSQMGVLTIQYKAELKLLKKQLLAKEISEKEYEDRMKLIRLIYRNDQLELIKNYDNKLSSLESKGEILSLRLKLQSHKVRMEVLKAEYDEKVRVIELIEDETEKQLKLNNAKAEYALAQKDAIKDRSLGDILGISDDSQEFLNTAIDQAQVYTDRILELTERRIEAIQRELDANQDRIATLQADRDHEWERMQEGYANNYDLKQRELNDEKARTAGLKKQEQKALDDRRKVANAQIAIDTVLQLSSLLTAAANIFKANSGIPFGVGVALAVASIAVMAAAYLSFKANAQDMAGYAEGVVGLNGDGTEKSDSIPARLSRGESVMTAKTTKPNKRTLKYMQDNPTHPLFRAIEKQGVNSVFNKLSDEMQNNWVMLNTGTDNKWDEKMYLELKNGNEELRNRPYSYMEGGKLYTIKGNQVVVTTIRNG